MTSKHPTPCDWNHAHEGHVMPGLENWCPGVAAEWPGEHHHTAACSNRRLTNNMRPFNCICDLPGYDADTIDNRD